VLQVRPRALDGALELVGGEGACVRGVAAPLDVVVRIGELRVGGDQVDHGDPPTRAGDADHLIQLLEWLGEVMQREPAEREVERVGGEGQPGGVGACQRHPVERAVTESAAGDVEHLGREVGAHDATDLRSDRLALVGTAARDFEDEHRRVERLQVACDPRREAGVGEERVLTLERRRLATELGPDGAVVLASHVADSGSRRRRPAVRFARWCRAT
jgi:hypothetical protein